jgi:toxin ParE1/3/4
VKLVWSHRAQNGLLDLQEFARQKPSLGNRVADSLDSVSQQISSFPQSGRPGRIEGTREVVLTGTPFLLTYEVEPECMAILAIIHGAHHWPAEL